MVRNIRNIQWKGHSSVAFFICHIIAVSLTLIQIQVDGFVYLDYNFFKINLNRFYIDAMFLFSTKIWAIIWLQ